MLWIILGIVLFLFLVIIHELGHFIAAKKTWVKVLEFGMGIPPKIATLWTDKSGTEYTLNAIPLGGFVRLKGEDPTHPQTFRAQDSFIMASFLSKTIILLAWVTVNFFFAWWVLTMLFWRGISPLMIVPENSSTMEIKSYLTPTVSFLLEQGVIQPQNAQPSIATVVMKDGLADTIGIQSGDTIATINNFPVNSLTLKKVLKNNIWQPFTIGVERPLSGWAIVVDGKDTTQSLTLSGTCPEDNCVLGVIMNDLKADQLVVHYQFWFIKSAEIALKELWYQARTTLYRLGKFWSSLLSFNGKNIKSEAKNFSWPVGAVKFGDVLVEHKMRSQFLAFWAMISFALAVFNLLPIPALDGGRWLWVIVQSVFFKKHVEKYFMIESYLNFAVFWLLMILGIYIILKDLVVAWGFTIPWIW